MTHQPVLGLSLLLIIYSMVVACKPAPADPAPATSTPATKDPIVTKTRATPESTFDTLGISKEVFQDLLSRGDHIDIIFNDLPVSMNQDGNQSIHQDLQYISSQPVKDPNTPCTPLARKIFMSRGEILLEADLYYGPACYFQVFIKDGKELYGNYLTPDGIAFVKQLLQSINAANPNQ